jgi:diguanylate cyclase (GGDEF)-like protein
MQFYFSKEETLSKFKGINHIIEIGCSGQVPILYFLSPNILLKASILNCWVTNNKKDMASGLSKTFKLLTLNFDSDSALENFIDIVTEDNLAIIYAYYAKHKTIPSWVLNKLLKLSKEKHNNERITFLIEIFLSYYFLQDNNFDLVDSHIKYCIEYVNNNIDNDEYENMITYIICGRYLEKTKDIFVSYAINYYSLAEAIANKLEDKLTLSSILNSIAYYYHNIDRIDMALDYGNKALVIAKSLDIPEIYFETYKHLAIIANTIGDFINSSVYIRNAIDFAEKIKDFSILENIKLKNTLGFVYYLKGSFKEAYEVHLAALKTLPNVSSSSELLEEAIKTFDNLSTACRNLGDINRAIYFAELTTNIIKDTNFGNRINDIQNLCKQYTDLGMLYGLFLNNFDNALKFYNLAKLSISKEDHYIKVSNLMILQSYVEYESGKLAESQNTFFSSIELLKKHGSTNIYVNTLLICYYIYFSTKFQELKDNYLQNAYCIAVESKLEEHFYLYKDYFVDKRASESITFYEKDYNINLILLLSEERRNLLEESKKSRDFQLIQNYSNRISLVFSQQDLYKESQEMFKKYFLAKGFIVIKHSFSGGFDTNITSDKEYDNNTLKLKEYIEDFILRNNLILNSNIKEYDIFNYPLESDELFKSMMIFYLYDEMNSCNYFFIMFYDKKSDWLFSHADANVGLILIKNLFLKLKNIHYTEKIRKNSLMDHATGLYNARYMWNTLSNYINQHMVKGLNFSMTIMDLNHFKSINDTYGHYAGDEAIKFFAKILRLSINPNSHIIRYGGDEFIIISNGCPKFEIENEILQLSNLCKTQPFVFDGNNIFLSFSFGILQYDSCYETGKNFFNAVDKEMYLNKKSAGL